jgi:hypothetical protein
VSKIITPAWPTTCGSGAAVSILLLGPPRPGVEGPHGRRPGTRGLAVA